MEKFVRFQKKFMKILRILRRTFGKTLKKHKVTLYKIYWGVFKNVENVNNF